MIGKDLSRRLYRLLVPATPEPSGGGCLADVCFWFDDASRKRRATSSALARLLKAEMRKKPSPLEPNPLPGVMTTFSSRNIQSKVCQLVLPAGVSTQIYGAFVPPCTPKPALVAASRKIRALPM